MSNEYSDDYNQKLSRYRKRRKRIVTVVLTLIAIISIVIIAIVQNMHYDSYVVIDTYDRGDSTTTEYEAFGNYIVKYSSNGITLLDKNGKEKWNVPYEFQNPLIDISSTTIAVANKSGNDIYIFDESGQIGSVSTSLPISGIEVASQGVVAAIEEEELVNYIFLYDKNGTELAKAKTTVAGDGYPLDIALSNDGQKLAVSYLYLNSAVCESSVVFYNFSEIGQNYTDNMVGAFRQYGDTIIPVIEFIDNDTVCAFGDDMFSIYTIDEIPELSFEKSLTAEIETVFNDGSNIGFVFDSTTENNRYDVEIYNLKGEMVFDKEIAYGYSDIELSNDEVYIYSDTSLYIYAISGREKFSYKFDQTIDKLISAGSFNKYILVTETDIEKIRLTK